MSNEYNTFRRMMNIKLEFLTPPCQFKIDETSRVCVSLDDKNDMLNNREYLLKGREMDGGAFSQAWPQFSFAWHGQLEPIKGLFVMYKLSPCLNGMNLVIGQFINEWDALVEVGFRKHHRIVPKMYRTLLVRTYVAWTLLLWVVSCSKHVSDTRVEHIFKYLSCTRVSCTYQIGHVPATTLMGYH